MKSLFIIATLLFWLAVAGLAVRPATPPVAPAAAPPSMPATGGDIAPAELARHRTPQDCWMAIDGSVYDLSAYLPRHPADDGLLDPWCGRDASEAYRTKLLGRPHSARADRLLQTYRIGRLQPPR